MPLLNIFKLNISSVYVPYRHTLRKSSHSQKLSKWVYSIGNIRTCLDIVAFGRCFHFKKSIIKLRQYLKSATSLMQVPVLTDTDYGVIMAGYPWESAEHNIQEELDNPEVNWSSSYNTGSRVEKDSHLESRVATFILGTFKWIKRKTMLCCVKLQHNE